MTKRLVLAAVLVLALPGAAAGKPTTVLHPAVAKRTLPTCTSTLVRVQELKVATWTTQLRLGVRMTSASAEPITSCRYAGWVERQWQKRLGVAREQWQRRALPSTNDWQTSVALVQRIHPGTRGWLLSCSASEGGHGNFVLNRQGSGAAGWLQYMPSTFDWMWNAALKDASSRGFIIPRSAASLYSPLGQALAGAWAVRNGHSGHWYGSGC